MKGISITSPILEKNDYFLPFLQQTMLKRAKVNVIGGVDAQLRYNLRQIIFIHSGKFLHDGPCQDS